MSQPEETKPRDHLTMFRPTLRDLPPNILPPDVRVRHMRIGEEVIWEKIANAAYPEYQPMRFDEKMRGDMAFTPERVLFLLYRDEPVAIAGAWREEAFGPDCGYVNWVGTLPGQTGRGFGRIVTLAALNRLREEGCLSAALHTRDWRVPAIKIYLKLGFHVQMDHPSVPKRWAEVLRKIEETPGTK